MQSDVTCRRQISWTRGARTPLRRGRLDHGANSTHPCFGRDWRHHGSVAATAIEESGTATLQDALNQFPSFTIGGNAGTGGQGTGGRASNNLHGLGTNRNLVLLDGRCLPASDINGNVDINILPDTIIIHGFRLELSAGCAAAIAASLEAARVASRRRHARPARCGSPCYGPCLRCGSSPEWRRAAAAARSPPRRARRPSPY